MAAVLLLTSTSSRRRTPSPYTGGRPDGDDYWPLILSAIFVVLIGVFITVAVAL